MQTETDRIVAACLLALSFVASARAEDAAPASPPVPAAAGADAAQDPPSRVGRLSYLTGKVLLHPPGDGDWTAATRNYPITTGESFWADQGALMEVQVAGASIRVGGSTELGVVTLDDNRIALKIPEGSVNIVVDKLTDGAIVEATTPAGVVQIFATGRYHIDAGTDSSPPRAQAFTGLARLIVSGSTLDVKDGEAGIVSGLDPAVFVTRPAEPDELDKWATEREHSVEAAARPKPRPKPAGDLPVSTETHDDTVYVSEQIPGSYELAQSGQWDNAPDHGPIWYPTDVPADWAPYRYGRWAFVPPWGWTWVDDAPWGFAPFHYGRWAYVAGRWGWTPGEVVARPVYAPALVAFVGIGAVAGIGAGPAIGWIPLGPQEVFVPAYRVSDTYIRNVNITNVTNVTNIDVRNGVVGHEHLNRNFVTAVHQNDFAASHPVQHAALALPPSAFAKGPGPIIRDPGLRPHLDPVAANEPPARIKEHPLAGRGLPVVPAHLETRPSPGARTTVPPTNLALPPPPKDAVHGGASGPGATKTGAIGIAPPSPPTVGHSDPPSLKRDQPGVKVPTQPSAVTRPPTTVTPKTQGTLDPRANVTAPRVQPPAAALTLPQRPVAKHVQVPVRPPPAAAITQPQRAVTQRVQVPQPQVNAPPRPTAIKTAPPPPPPNKNKDKDKKDK